jgi:hypothetical protein
MMKEMTGGRRLEPATPESTKYALFFAAVAAIGGVVCLVAAFRKKEDGSRADYGPAP